MAIPYNFWLTTGSLTAAAVMILLFYTYRDTMSNRVKIALIYGSIVLTVFPIFHYVYAKTCGSVMISCGKWHALLYSLMGSLGIALVALLLLTPLLVRWRKQRVQPGTDLDARVRMLATAVGVKVPRVYVKDSAQPVAYTVSHISPLIIISVGMLELLDQDELDAVLLHELGHIRQRTGLLKTARSMLRLMLPIAGFNAFGKELDEEESRADMVAAHVQGTTEHLLSAKERLSLFADEQAMPSSL